MASSMVSPAWLATQWSADALLAPHGAVSGVLDACEADLVIVDAALPVFETGAVSEVEQALLASSRAVGVVWAVKQYHRAALQEGRTVDAQEAGRAVSFASRAAQAASFLEAVSQDRRVFLAGQPRLRPWRSLLLDPGTYEFTPLEEPYSEFASSFEAFYSALSGAAGAQDPVVVSSAALVIASASRCAAADLEADPAGSPGDGFLSRKRVPILAARMAAARFAYTQELSPVSSERCSPAAQEGMLESIAAAFDKVHPDAGAVVRAASSGGWLAFETPDLASYMGGWVTPSPSEALPPLVSVRDSAQDYEVYEHAAHELGHVAHFAAAKWPAGSWYDSRLIEEVAAMYFENFATSASPEFAAPALYRTETTVLTLARQVLWCDEALRTGAAEYIDPVTGVRDEVLPLRVAYWLGDYSQAALYLVAEATALAASHLNSKEQVWEALAHSWDHTWEETLASLGIDLSSEVGVSAMLDAAQAEIEILREQVSTRRYKAPAVSSSRREASM